MAKHLHFVEIAGNTMSGLAVASKLAGNIVTGTDENGLPPSTDFLNDNQIKWWASASPDHLDGVDEVIISGGSPADYPEFVAARERNIPLKPFAQLWGELIRDEYSIVVSGTHGKTTTSALVAWLLEGAGRRPDYLIGVRPKNLDSSVRFQNGAVAVTEGDEYQASRLEPTSKFAYYHPDMLVVTSVEMDHPDLFRDLSEVEARFRELARSLKPEAKLFLCVDDAGSIRLSGETPGTVVTYGLESGDWHCGSIHFNAAGISFTVFRAGEELGQVQVALYGRHNVLNALAAVAMAITYGLSWSDVTTAAHTFKGTARRFSIMTASGALIRVIDDYAHHPTAAKATIEATKLHFPGRVIAVYQPHTYSRTKALLSQYKAAFGEADATFLAPIDASRERHLEKSVSSHDIANGAAGNVKALDDRAELVEAVVAAAHPGDTILVMSVGGYQNLAKELAERMGTKA